MRSWTIAFAAGVCLAQFFPVLPSSGWLLLLVGFALTATRYRAMRQPAALLVGLVWALSRAALMLQTSLPASLEGQAVVLQGEVVGLPESDAESVRFRFRVASITAGARTWSWPGVVRLDWRGAPPGAIHAGERWRIPARLKRPHGLANPGGFDYELWLLQQRIRATGYVLDDAQPARMQAAGRSVDALRDAIAVRLDAAIGWHPLHGIVAALAIGDRSDITPAQWQVFYRTNIGHLIAISGLHIGLVAMAGFLLSRGLWSLSPTLLTRVAAQRVGALGGVAFAAGYCLLAGFEVPSQRTLIMIATVAAARCLARRAAAADTLRWALLLVLLFDPLSVTAVGFWLSFVAVAILLYAMDEIRSVRQMWHRLGGVHLVMAIGLAPLLVLFFGEQPLAGPLANLFAVPWISFVVVPLTLLGTALVMFGLTMPGDLLLHGALTALDMLWRLVEPLSRWQWANVPVAHPAPMVMVCSVVAVACLLLPRGLPGRAAGVAWLAPLFLHLPPAPDAGTFDVTVLDVGQGLSTVVRTATHVMVFDAGPAFGTRFDAGASVVVPYLRYHGVRKVDRLIVSHGDNDHVGGVASLIRAVPVTEVLTSTPARVLHPKVGRCARGQRWRWDGVDFEVLWPPRDFAGSDNDGSCMLRVSAAATGRSALLTGDIEARGERQLIEGATELHGDVVVVPHHGSRSSSSDAFVDAVKASVAVFPVGYRNRWRFPDATVVARWRQAGANIMRTDLQGAVLCRSRAQVIHCEGYRARQRRYWHEQ